MNVLVIGSNGKVGRHIVKFLSGKGISVRAMVRKESQMEAIAKLGAEPYLADLEKDFSSAYEEMDYVIFTAGSGGHTGPDKTIDIDQNAAIRSVDVAKQYRIKRYLMVSALGAGNPDQPSPIQHYFKAKAIADNYLVDSGQSYTIFRPGRLTDDEGNALIALSEKLDYKGSIPRIDLAKTLVESLEFANTENKILDILEGEVPIREALRLI